MTDETLESTIRLTATDEASNVLQSFTTKLRDLAAVANAAITGGEGHHHYRERHADAAGWVCGRGFAALAYSGQINSCMNRRATQPCCFTSWPS
jgi:hypothetical protein